MAGDPSLISTRHLSRSVYLLPFEEGNVALCAGKDGAIIVDTPQLSAIPQIQAAVNHFASGTFCFLINTHGHSDHTAGNAILGEHMPIIAHRNVRKQLMTDRHITIGIQTVIPAQKPTAWPRLVFDQAMTLNLNDEEINLIHFPHGHSDGDGIVWFMKANVVHLGDILWPNVFPFVDVQNGGSVDGLICNVDKIINLLPPDVCLIPGHGAISDMQDLKAYHHMLVETTNWICSQKKANKTFEEIYSTLPEEWSSWGQGFISPSAWVEMVLYSYGFL
jgi:cyclase